MNNLLQNIELALSDNVSLFALRSSGAKIFELPTKKSENWKYTSLKTLERDDYVVDTSECDHSHCHHDEQALPFETYEIKVCN